MARKQKDSEFEFMPEGPKAEWNMMMQDIIRLNFAMGKAEEFSFEFINTRHSVWLERYYSALKAVFRILKPLMTGKYRDSRNNYKSLFDVVYNNLYTKGKLKPDDVIHRRLEYIHEMLLDSRQTLGLGIRLQPGDDEEEMNALRRS